MSAGRAQMIERVLVLSMEPVQVVADATGVSAPTVYKWLNRWKGEEDAELEGRSSRLHRMPRQRCRQIERLVRQAWSTPGSPGS